MTTADSRPPTVAVVQDYLADLGKGDIPAAMARFSPELVYAAPGRNQLAGVRTGPTGAGDWFGAMMQLSGGTYGVADTVDWLASDTHALLLAREHATVAGRDHDWLRAVLFTVEGSLMSRVQLFEDDQYAYDAWLGNNPAGTEPAHGSEQPPAGPPEMTGDLDDARVRAVLSYQRQVATGDLDSARAIFWDDVTYTVPGTSLLAGTMNGPDEVMGYFARLGELTNGTYAISRMHWLTSADRVGLVTRNHATRGPMSLAWDEVIVFTFVDGRKKHIAHFSGDQHGVDALFTS